MRSAYVSLVVSEVAGGLQSYAPRTLKVMSQDALTASSGRSHLQQVEDLVGPAGRLEALLNTGAPEAPFAAVLCHPYPPAGGTMHTKVVYHATKVLSGLGIPVLRFNFRGVGRSTGSFDHGNGEQDDVRAAIDWLARTYQRPLLFAGFSFGSYVGLRACCSDPRLIGRIALGLPVRAAGRNYTYDFLERCPGPLLAVSGSEDEFCPPEILRRTIGTDPGRTIVLVPGADHFFQGTPGSPETKLTAMQVILQQWIHDERLIPRPLETDTIVSS